MFILNNLASELAREWWLTIIIHDQSILSWSALIHNYTTNDLLPFAWFFTSSCPHGQMIYSAWGIGHMVCEKEEMGKCWWTHIWLGGMWVFLTIKWWPIVCTWIGQEIEGKLNQAIGKRRGGILVHNHEEKVKRVSLVMQGLWRWQLGQLMRQRLWALRYII